SYSGAYINDVQELATGLVELKATAETTDGDGDTATGSATLDLGGNVKFGDDGPSVAVTVSPDTVYLDESVGTDGSQQDEPGNAASNDEEGETDPFAAKNFGNMIGYASLAAALTISVNAGADGLGDQSVSLTDDSGNAHNGTATSLSLSSTGQTVYLFTEDGIIVGRAGDDAVDAVDGTVAFAIGFAPNETDVEVAQYAALSHSNTTTHDDAVGLDQLVHVTVSVTDGDGDSAEVTSADALNIAFEDDGPDAINDSAQLMKGQTDFNIVFVLDFSGSINNTELATMLSAVEAAGEAFFDNAGEVQIYLVAFSSTATSAGPFTDFTSFVDQLDDWNPAEGGTRPFNGNTDFTDAIEETMDVYVPLAEYNNQVFFLSDGNPNQQTGTGGHSLANSTRADWNTFVSDNDITVQTIGIGNGVDEARLQDVDEADGDDTVITVDDFDDLVDALVNLASVESISGNVLLGDDGVVGGGDDDSFGEDGGRILSIQVGTVLYTYDADADEITNNGGEPTQPGSELSVTTPANGLLAFNFATGAWTYTAGGSTSNGVEAFEYTLIDNDGDTSSATLSIEVIPAPGANNDIVLTNITDFSPIDIPEEALLNNDTETGSPLSVNSVSDPDGGTVAMGVEFDPQAAQFTKTYDFDGVTRGTNDHFAYSFEFDPPGNYSGLADLTAAVGIGGPGSPSAVEATNGDYQDIAEVGNGDWDLPDPGDGNDNDHAVFWAQFQIDEDAANIVELNVSIDVNSSGSGLVGNGSDLGIWNYSSSQWVQLDGSAGGGGWSGSITSNIADYLDPSTNQLTVAFVNSTDDRFYGVDYVSVEVVYDEASFTSGSFDYEVTDGNGFNDTANVTITGVDSTTVTGTGENEVLIGNDSSSTLDGAGGNDYLVGGASADTLIGGEGEDVLAGGLGADTLWGGTQGGLGDGDKDTFVIDDATATDIISDFEANVDEIDLSDLLTLALGTDVEGDGAAGGTPDYVHYNSASGDLTVDQGGNAASGGGDVVANLGTGLGDETIKILFSDGGGNKGSDTV
ncbi:DUF5801 repeats-in-toxin domain-containing protein, partial [Roseibium sp. SCP14]|uniref:DUF5801 repeats-in-toxin domain-containing protein n=1 Tax=Roseibium sp. SCP14 TaxID=3141375 RepID=UPI0033388CA7